VYRRGDILTLQDGKPALVVERRRSEFRVARDNTIIMIEYDPEIVVTGQAYRLADELSKIAAAMPFGHDVVWRQWLHCELDERGRLSADSKQRIMDACIGQSRTRRVTPFVFMLCS